VPIGALFGVLEALLPRTLGPNIEIVFDRPATDLCVLADGTQLELALLNLALNARDAMPDGGMLVIAASPDSEDGAPDLAVGPPVRLTVSDSGAGMAPDVLARAFEPFFTTKGVGKGTGLGLSQVFGLAERAGGTARIESRVGQGTSVHIILPSALPSRTEAGAGSDADRGSAWAGGGKVLVIDDDPGVREVLVGHLQDLGLAVAQASDGPSGLDMLDTTAPDLLLVDFAMPGMNGAEVVRAARARFPDLPVVFVSGYADSDAIDRAVGQNALILRKPFRAHELRAILAEALRPEGVASPASV
jgi:CheY-like chemotaxis protein